MPDRTCSVEGCDRPHYAKTWCQLHWRRHRKRGTTDDPTPTPTTCIVESCDKPYMARGWCIAHYAKWQKYGDPLHVQQKSRQRCTIDECRLFVVGRGWCEKHYRRWQNNGDPNIVQVIVGDDVARFEQYLSLGEPPAHRPTLGACWLWTSGLSPDGYAKFYAERPGRNREQFGHRWSYTHHIGPIPDGLELDHLCRVRRCVNPWHLDPVTRQVNILRAAEVRYGHHFADARTPSSA